MPPPTYLCVNHVIFGYIQSTISPLDRLGSMAFMFTQQKQGIKQSSTIDNNNEGADSGKKKRKMNTSASASAKQVENQKNKSFGSSKGGGGDKRRGGGGGGRPRRVDDYVGYGIERPSGGKENIVDKRFFDCK